MPRALPIHPCGILARVEDELDGLCDVVVNKAVVGLSISGDLLPQNVLDQRLGHCPTLVKVTKTGGMLEMTGVSQAQSRQLPKCLRGFAPCVCGATRAARCAQPTARGIGVSFVLLYRAEHVCVSTPPGGGCRAYVGVPVQRKREKESADGAASCLGNPSWGCTSAIGPRFCGLYRIARSRIPLLTAMLWCARTVGSEEFHWVKSRVR